MSNKKQGRLGVIKASPLELIDITCFYNPLWFIVSSFGMALGIFVIWTGVFYFLASGFFSLILFTEALISIILMPVMEGMNILRWK